MLFGATDMDPQWFSAVIQGGSFALVVVIMVWLLPKLRKEISDERNKDLDGFKAHNAHQEERFTSTMATISKAYSDDSKAQRDAHSADMKAEREACDRHFETLASSISKGQDATIKAVQAMTEQGMRHQQRNMEYQEILRREVEKKEKLPKEDMG